MQYHYTVILQSKTAQYHNCITYKKPMRAHLTATNITDVIAQLKDRLNKYTIRSITRRPQ